MNATKPFYDNSKRKTRITGVVSKYKFLLLAIAVFTFPALLTQTGLSIFDFSNTGQIGDTIGGITAPFVGLVSVYMIYKAFEVQVKANRIESKNNEFGIALKLIDDLELRLTQKNKPYEYSVGDEVVSKVDNADFFEIINFWNGMRKYRNGYRGQVVLLIRQINFFRNFVRRSENLSAVDEALLLQKASLAFGTRLFDAFDTLLMTETESLDQDDKRFYEYCRKFYQTTLKDLLFHLIDSDDYDDM